MFLHSSLETGAARKCERTERWKRKSPQKIQRREQYSHLQFYTRRRHHHRHIVNHDSHKYRLFYSYTLGSFIFVLWRIILRHDLSRRAYMRRQGVRGGSHTKPHAITTERATAAETPPPIDDAISNKYFLVNSILMQRCGGITCITCSRSHVIHGNLAKHTYL